MRIGLWDWHTTGENGFQGVREGQRWRVDLLLREVQAGARGDGVRFEHGIDEPTIDEWAALRDGYRWRRRGRRWIAPDGRYATRAEAHEVVREHYLRQRFEDASLTADECANLLVMRDQALEDGAAGRDAFVLKTDDPFGIGAR